MSSANRCKKAPVSSCTECIRVDKDCAYCTDEVSGCQPACLRGGPKPGSPALPCPSPGSGHVHTCHTLSPALGQAGVGEQGRVRKVRGNKSRVGAVRGWALPPDPVFFRPDVQGQTLQYRDRAAGCRLPAGEHGGHEWQLQDHRGAWSRGQGRGACHAQGWLFMEVHSVPWLSRKAPRRASGVTIQASCPLP